MQRFGSFLLVKDYVVRQGMVYSILRLKAAFNSHISALNITQTLENVVVIPKSKEKTFS